MDLNVLMRYPSYAKDLWRAEVAPTLGVGDTTEVYADPDAPSTLEVLKSNKFYINLAKDFGRGFAVGAGGNIAISVLPLLVKMRAHNYKLQLMKAAAAVLEGNWKRWGLFVGMYVASNKAVLALTRKTRNWMRRYRGGLAGLVGGLSIFLAPRTSGRVSLVLLIIVRALEVLFRSEKVSGAFPKFEHYDTALVCFSSMIILPIWINHRDHGLSKSYNGFLDTQGGRQRAWYQALADLCKYGPSGVNLDALRSAHPFYAKNIVNPPTETGNFFRYILHPTQGWADVEMVRFILKSFKRTVPVYLPVYVIPLLLFNRKKLVKDPLRTLLQTATNIGRSSLFLSAYCGFAWRTIELSFALGIYGPFSTCLAGLGSGLAALFEKRSRRIELGLYILRQAIEGLWNYLVWRGFVFNVPHGDGILFVLSSAMIMHSFVSAPDRLRLTYRSLLKNLLGRSHINRELQPQSEDRASAPE